MLCSQICSISYAHNAIHALFLSKLPSNEERKKDCMTVILANLSTTLNNAEVSLHAGVAGGNCIICFSSICIFFVILDLQDRIRECVSQMTHSNSIHSMGFYLFKIGLGIHRGVGDCVYFVAIKISMVETGNCLFE